MKNPKMYKGKGNAKVMSTTKNSPMGTDLGSTNKSKRKNSTKGATIYASKKQASRPIKKQSRYEPTRYKSVNYKQY